MNLNNMSKNSVYTQISNLFLKISNYESEIEKLRQILNNMPNFDLYQIFMNISSDNKISPYDLFSFYSKMNNNVINKSLFSNIIFFYDEDRDSCLSYSEFMSFILSDTNFNLRRCSHDKICCAEFESELPNDIREGIYNIIEKELEMIITIITSNKSIDYSKEEFFNEVKINEYITPTSIWKIFTLGLGNSSTNVYSGVDVDNIMKRFDVNRDCKIDFIEFKTIMEFGREDKGEEILNTGSENNVIEYDIKGQRESSIQNNEHRINVYDNNEINNSQFGSSYYNNYNKQFRINYSNKNTINQDEINERNEDYFANDYIEQENKNNYYDNNHYMENKYNKFQIPSTKQYNQLFNNNNNLDCCIHRQSRNNSLEVGQNSIDVNNNYSNNYSKNLSVQYNVNSPNTCTVNNGADSSISTTLILRKGPQRHYRMNLNFIYEFQFFLHSLMTIESELESKKAIIAERTDFNVETIFSHFESQSKPDIININNMQQGLNSFSVYPNEKELYLFMKRYDLNHKGFITYTEFFDIVTPYEKNLRDLVEMRTANEIPKKNLLFQTKNLLKDLFETILNYECHIEKQRMQLTYNHDNANIIFQMIDKDNKGFFTCEDLYKLINELFHNDQVKRKECDLLFIRLDRKRNGKIELWELENELIKCDMV